MRKYEPVGKTATAQIKDLIGEATAHGEYTVGNVVGIQVGVWPGDNPATVYTDYEQRRDKPN